MPGHRSLDGECDPAPPRQGNRHPRVVKALRALEGLRARLASAPPPVPAAAAEPGPADAGEEAGAGMMAEVEVDELGWDTEVDGRPEAWIMGALRALVEAGAPPPTQRGPAGCMRAQTGSAAPRPSWRPACGRA